ARRRPAGSARQAPAPPERASAAAPGPAPRAVRPAASGPEPSRRGPSTAPGPPESCATGKSSDTAPEPSLSDCLPGAPAGAKPLAPPAAPDDHRNRMVLADNPMVEAARAGTLPARRTAHIVDVLIAERAPRLTGSRVWPLVRPVLYGLLD